MFLLILTGIETDLVLIRRNFRTAASIAAGGLLLPFSLGYTIALPIRDDLLGDPSRRSVFTLVIATALAFGAIAQALDIEALLGAFVAGILLGQNPRLPVDVVRRLHTMALAVFAPVFFAIAGLKVDVTSLAEPRLAGVAAMTSQSRWQESSPAPMPAPGLSASTNGQQPPTGQP